MRNSRGPSASIVTRSPSGTRGRPAGSRVSRTTRSRSARSRSHRCFPTNGTPRGSPVKNTIVPSGGLVSSLWIFKSSATGICDWVSVRRVRRRPSRHVSESASNAIATASGIHAPSRNFGRLAPTNVASTIANAANDGMATAGFHFSTRVATTTKTIEVASIVPATARP